LIRACVAIKAISSPIRAMNFCRMLMVVVLCLGFALFSRAGIHAGQGGF
jgi:hypothetical protein